MIACRREKGRIGTFTLADAGIRENCQLSVVIKGPELEKNDYVMPNTISVEVLIDGEQVPRQFEVEVSKFTGKKAYLGGFRNKKTELVYHHATTQTLLAMKKTRTGPPQFHRETQTTVVITRSQQTKREAGTQMERKDIHIDTVRDRIVRARAYFDSTQHHYLKTSSVLSIQCLWRGYVARCRAQAIRDGRLKRKEAAEAESSIERVESEAKHKIEVQRRMQPKTFDDFEILYNELDNWRQFETTRARGSSKTKEETQKALKLILEKETKLLQTIDRLKQSASSENRKERIQKMMQVMSRPKQWEMSDGQVQEVHTPFTIRAKELKDLYTGLMMSLVSVDERLDVLLHVKWTVKEFECPLTRELVQLIDREADLLNRGRRAKSLDGLRRRIGNLFLQFIETPEFNPEAAQFQLT